MKRDKPALQRVFKRLCNYSVKAKYIHVLEYKTKRQTKLIAALTRPENKLIDRTGKPLTVAELQEELMAINEEIEKCRTRIEHVNKKGRPRISVKDLMQSLKDLDYPMSKAQVKDMMWEVDEDLDDHVNWHEFYTMYTRNVADKSGLEPSQLYNVIQFMVYDKDNSGTVSIDETMMMLFQRYGKHQLEQELQKLFGANLNGDGELKFAEFLEAMEVTLTLDQKYIPSKRRGRKVQSR